MKPGARVGFQGESGAFSEEALLVLLPEARPVPRRTFRDAVRAVAEGADEAALLPVENTLAGGVAATFDALQDAPLQAVREVVIPIRHALLGVPGADAERLREVRSHPVALAQCQRFFEAHPGVRAVPVHDTAGAAREVAAAGDPTVAALASRHAAAPYGLDVLAEDLQDRSDNQTRFLLVVPVQHPWAHPASGGDMLKTALIAETENRPGALHGLLGVFAARGLDLTFIESRPTGTPWTYRFILEFRHSPGQDAEGALAAAAGACRSLRRLGTFVPHTTEDASGA